MSPSVRPTPPPSSRGFQPGPLCRGPVSRSRSVQDGLVGSGFPPASWPYDLRLTAGCGDRPCWGPWWVQSELTGEESISDRSLWSPMTAWTLVLLQNVTSFILWSGMDSHFSISSRDFGSGFSSTVAGGAERKKI